MTLKVENIYKNLNLYIFTSLILLFILNKDSIKNKLKKIVEDKYINITILLLISVLLCNYLKFGILISFVYINLLF